MGRSNNRGKETSVHSLKRIAFQFPPGPIRTYLHGKWQQGRGKGRKSSLVFGNHTDPQAAFAAAEALVGEYVESIRRLRLSRHWSWDTRVVDAMLAQLPPERVLELARCGELCRVTYCLSNNIYGGSGPFD